MTANHLQNRLPICGDAHTPFERWEGRKPNLNYTRRFGCTAYMKIHDEKRRKLDNKARKLTFVGYESGTKGYRLLDTATDNIYVSRDVIFLEGDPHTSYQTPDGSVEMPSVLCAPADNEAEVEVKLHEDDSDNRDPQLVQQQDMQCSQKCR